MNRKYFGFEKGDSTFIEFEKEWKKEFGKKKPNLRDATNFIARWQRENNEYEKPVLKFK